MINLPDVTLLVCDTVNYGDAINAIQKTLKQITPARTIFFTDIDVKGPFELIKIDHLYSSKEYSKWIIKELGKYHFGTSHLLIIQHDGYVLDGEQWDDEFLKTDLVGAPWLWTDSLNMGNGGFTLRSTRLHKILAEDPFIKGYHQEDAAIGRTYRPYLEENYGIVFATEEQGHRFSFELHEPKQPTFGFHGRFHPPYKEPVVFRRLGAMGDVAALEPVMHHFHLLGHPIVLDSPLYMMYSRHYFPVKSYDQFDHQVIKHRLINLDMAYETKPQQLHLKSYFEMAAVTDYVLRNPKLNYKTDETNKMFRRYVVLHIDERETTHRNIFGFEWEPVIEMIKALGYDVIQIGHGTHEEVALHFNTVNVLVLMWLISGCDLMIAVDSGPASIAVALDKKCVLFFGSVNPEYIHPDLSKVKVLQSKCPIAKDGCWHSEPGTRGVECSVDQVTPPCCVHELDDVLNTIEEALK